MSPCRKLKLLVLSHTGSLNFRTRRGFTRGGGTDTDREDDNTVSGSIVIKHVHEKTINLGSDQV